MSKNKTPSGQQTDASRRRFFATAGGALGVAVLANALPSIARADDLPHLTLDDPTAKALNYTEDNTKAGPPHQAGQDCSNCNFYQGGPTGYGPCQLFVGKSVNAKGWCAGYAKKA
jgi:High potential iron-sulfur protein